MSAAKCPVAALAAAAVLAWMPAAQAGTSFSFSIHGGDHYRHGPYYGGHYKHYKHYHGPPRGYWESRRFSGHPRHYGYKYGYKPNRRPWHSYHGPRYYYRAPGPHCIYRYGHRYCR